MAENLVTEFFNVTDLFLDKGVLDCDLHNDTIDIDLFKKIQKFVPFFSRHIKKMSFFEFF